MDSPEFLTLPHAASPRPIRARTGCDPAYDPARTQPIPAAKVGGQGRVRRTDLDAWIARGGEAHDHREST